ncbi:MAG: efflux RND transporter periplasmic adaptor subunit [Dysgonomonas sp.]
MNSKRLSVGLFSVLLLASCGNKQQNTGKEDAPQEYATTTVTAQSAELEAVYPVTIKGQEDIEIKPRVDGFIKAILVDEGSKVRKGQVLFTIDSPQTEQAVLTAQAAVNSAKAAVNTAKINVDRIRPLAQKNIVSNVQLETAQNSYDTALAGLAQAEASLTNAKASRSWASVTSPIDGVVGTIGYRQGSLATSSTLLTTVANISNVYAYFSLNEKDMMSFLKDIPGNSQAEKIKNIPPVTLTLADGSVYPEKGKIETISGVVNSNTGSANFRAVFANKEGALRSGTSGKVSIPRTMDNVFIIPQKSTFSQQDKVVLYKVQGDSVVQTIVSVLSLPNGQDYAVINGLSAGDKIVTDGVATLTNGKKIIAK